MTTAFQRRLEQKIHERIRDLEDVMGRGCPNWDTYKHSCGWIYGLRQALEIMEDISKEEE